MESNFEPKPGKFNELSTFNSGSRPVDLRSAYELLDFGDARKLERFAEKILDRPSPAAKGEKRKRPEAWTSPDFIYRDHSASNWSAEKSPDDWLFVWKGVVMELRLSPFGHVGLFPEQIANWRWLQSLAASNAIAQPPKALNLFAYTGGSTLAMAAAGWQVTHVDASRPTVQWAKRNARRSSLESAAIRWIVDDVRAFVKRAAKRADHYDLILMDPPAYGHGADGQGWTLARDIDDLVADCLRLLSPRPMAFLLTGHSPISSIENGPLSATSWNQLKSRFKHLEKHRVSLADSQLRKLDFGYAYRLSN